MTQIIKQTEKVKLKSKTKALNKALVSRSKNGGDRKNLLKGFKVETCDNDAGVFCNMFMTEAKDKIGALKNFLKNSWDLKNCTTEKNDWIIKITKTY